MHPQAHNLTPASMAQSHIIKAAGTSPTFPPFSHGAIKTLFQKEKPGEFNLSPAAVVITLGDRGKPTALYLTHSALTDIANDD